MVEIDLWGKNPEQAINNQLNARIGMYRDAAPLQARKYKHGKRDKHKTCAITKRTKATTIQEASTCCYRLSDLHACAMKLTKRFMLQVCMKSYICILSIYLCACAGQQVLDCCNNKPSGNRQSPLSHVQSTSNAGRKVSSCCRLSKTAWATKVPASQRIWKINERAWGANSHNTITCKVL